MVHSKDMATPSTERLNKFIALQRGVSRREADMLIEQGRVTINGVVATLGARFTPGDDIILNNQPLAPQTAHQYLLFHKPIGYVCSRRQQGDNPTIYSLLPAKLHALKPVGRLDKNSSGIIILTNNGDFAHRMTHPSYHKQKTYLVTLDQDLQPLHQQMISDFGVQLEDGVSKIALMRLSDTDRRHWQIDMHEGRNRQIRRTFAALGYTVTKLHRTQFGHYALGDIQQGAYKAFDIS